MGQSNTAPTEPNAIKVGLFGASRIAPPALIAPAKDTPSVIVYGVASRDHAKGVAYARKHGIPKVYSSYDEMLQDSEIDAVYNPLPNGLHCEWTVKALQHGKHVLCEKPFAANESEAAQMVAASVASGKVLMEAGHWRFHPVAKRLKEVIDSGEIGALQHIHAEMVFPAIVKYFASEAKDDDIRFKYDLAGGSMMDAGWYPLSIVRTLSGEEPSVTKAVPILMREQIDQEMSADLQLSNNATAYIRTSFRGSGVMPKLFVDIKGSAGSMYCMNPVLPHVYHYITVKTPQGSRTEKCYGPEKQSTYWHQLQAFVHAIRNNGEMPYSPTDAVAAMKIIDEIYVKAGLKKRGEKQ